MSVNVKNYTEQGGEKTVIGGTLEFLNGSSVTNFPKEAVLEAPEGEFYSEATTFEELRNDFNDFVEALNDAGLIKATNEKPDPINVVISK